MTVRLVLEGSTAIATIAHPPANTWDSASLGALVNILAGLQRRAEVRALIVTGEGSRFFSAGADLKQFDHSDTVRATSSMDAFAEAFDALAAFAGVTIAAINGVALGGGLECALACDIRVAETQAVLGLPEALVGLIPGGGGTQRLPRLVGPGWAKRIVLLGEKVDARTAERIGLVEAVVDEGEALATARAWAMQACRSSPAASAAGKQLIDASIETGLADGLGRERSAFVDLFGSADQSEGVRAFFQKRLPVWGAHS